VFGSWVAAQWSAAWDNCEGWLAGNWLAVLGCCYGAGHSMGLPAEWQGGRELFDQCGVSAGVELLMSVGCCLCCGAVPAGVAVTELPYSAALR
jgi:hypothetical protein